MLTGSIALYSDALERIINVAAAMGAFLAVRPSAKPADKNHPYGHHKVEYFAAVIEGVLIVVAALSIFRAAYLAYLTPQFLTAPMKGLLVNAICRRNQRDLVLGVNSSGTAAAISCDCRRRKKLAHRRAVVGWRSAWCLTWLWSPGGPFSIRSWRH